MDRFIVGYKDIWIDRWMDSRYIGRGMDRFVVGYKDKWVDVWMDRWKDRYIGK
jgi:hypothetical protein